MKIDGFELFTVNWNNKTGGGVAVYVDLAFQCKLVENKSVTAEILLECVAIEILCKKVKKYSSYSSFVYKTPGSLIDVFNEEKKEWIT